MKDLGIDRKVDLGQGLEQRLQIARAHRNGHGNQFAIAAANRRSGRGTLPDVQTYQQHPVLAVAKASAPVHWRKCLQRPESTNDRQAVTLLALFFAWSQLARSGLRLNPESLRVHS